MDGMPARAGTHTTLVEAQARIFTQHAPHIHPAVNKQPVAYAELMAADKARSIENTKRIDERFLG